MELAYGEMGLSPEQLAGLTPFQFELKMKGYTNFISRREEDFRNLAWIVFSGNVSAKEIKAKSISKDDIWPTLESINRAKERNAKDTVQMDSIVQAFIRREELKKQKANK